MFGADRTKVLYTSRVTTTYVTVRDQIQVLRQTFDVPQFFSFNILLSSSFLSTGIAASSVEGGVES